MKEGEQFSLMPEFEQAGFAGDQKEEVDVSKLEEEKTGLETGTPIESSEPAELAGKPLSAKEIGALKEAEYWKKVDGLAKSKEEYDAGAKEWLPKIKETVADKSKENKKRQESTNQKAIDEKKTDEVKPKEKIEKKEEKEEYTPPYEDIYPFSQNFRRKPNMKIKSGN